jgi:hypothetical protein
VDSAAAARRLGRRLNAALRELWRERVWRIVPARVVAEEHGATLLWHPEATPVLRPFAGGRELRIPGDEPWTLEARSSATECLVFVRPGARSSLWLMWEHGVFMHWYVNFERETKWRGACFDLVDEKLDLVVLANGTSRLKDEDELVEAARRGYLDETEVRAELERVLARPPWPTGWEEWRPDASWPTPQLPEGWESV